MNESVKDRIFEAAVAELVEIGLDDFSAERVGRRAGVDPAVIAEHWPDRRVLLMDTMISRAVESGPSQDGGSLRQDLQNAADAAVAVLKTPERRKWFHRLLPHGRDADLYDVRRDFWESRFCSATALLERAAGRGELRDDVDPALAHRMFAAALCFDVIFNDAPIQPDHATQVVDIFVRGISR